MGEKLSLLALSAAEHEGLKASGGDDNTFPGNRGFGLPERDIDRGNPYHQQSKQVY